MSNSNLATYTKISPNRTSPRNHVIDTISIHCAVGQLTAKEILNLSHFVNYNSSNGVSCNYAVGKDGSIGLGVEEKDRSWCTSSRSNDHRAITIEVASDTTSPYAVTDKAYEALIELLTDICKRNNIKELKWKADKSLIGQVDKQNMTVHRWFANKSCPGDYLYNKHAQIAEEVNKRLGVQPDKPVSPVAPAKIDVTYRVKANGRWLPEVKNLEGYAGNIGQKITDLAVKVSKGSVKYRVHTGGRWLPWVTGYNINDFKNGYAGNGTPVDGVQIYFYTPDDVRPYQQAYYRVSEVKKDYFAWQEDTSTANGMDGYAGNANGKAIDRIQIQIKER